MTDLDPAHPERITNHASPQQGVVAVIQRHGRWLMIRRADEIAAGGWWCFPGGAIEPGESPTEALVREIQEEVGLHVTVGPLLFEWQRPDGMLTLAWYRADLVDPNQPFLCDPAEVSEARWLKPEQIRQLQPLLPNNLEFLDAMLTS